jgi:hypothetical protein
MTDGLQKTVIVLGGPTGPTGTIKGVNILKTFTGVTGEHAFWLQYTGGTGPKGILERVYNIGPTGVSGEHKTVFILGFSGATGF